MVIVDSHGRRDTVEIVLENRGDSIFRCTYVPVLEGLHTVHVTFAGQQIPRSPFSVHLSEGMLSSPESSSAVVTDGNTASSPEPHCRLLSVTLMSPELSEEVPDSGFGLGFSSLVVFIFRYLCLQNSTRGGRFRFVLDLTPTCFMKLSVLLPSA